MWCYVCGLNVDACDKAPRVGAAGAEPIYGHNQDWDTNPRRCPMYLHQISDVDEEWPDGDQYEEDGEDVSIDVECLERFHRHRTLRLLYSAYLELGPETFLRVRDRFGVANGFTVEQILTSREIPLIDRSNVMPPPPPAARAGAGSGSGSGSGARGW